MIFLFILFFFTWAEEKIEFFCKPAGIWAYHGTTGMFKPICKPPLAADQPCSNLTYSNKNKVKLVASAGDISSFVDACIAAWQHIVIDSLKQSLPQREVSY